MLQNKLRRPPIRQREGIGSFCRNDHGQRVQRATRTDNLRHARTLRIVYAHKYIVVVEVSAFEKWRCRRIAYPPAHALKLVEVDGMNDVRNSVAVKHVRRRNTGGRAGAEGIDEPQL